MESFTTAKMFSFSPGGQTAKWKCVSLGEFLSFREEGYNFRTPKGVRPCFFWGGQTSGRTGFLKNNVSLPPLLLETLFSRGPKQEVTHNQNPDK